MTSIFRVDAFISSAGGGNPAGVVLNGTRLSDLEMQKIAADLAHSETAFVLPSEVADLRLRYFAPGKEVDLCGHATIASLHLLHERGLVGQSSLLLETKAGIQQIRLGDGTVAMTQNPPHFGEVLPGTLVAPALGIESAELFDSSHIPVQIASTGLHKIFVPVSSIGVLEKITPDYEAIAAVSRDVGAIGFYVYSVQSYDGGDATCRNFAPVVGIHEDAATGTSAAALSCLLWKYGFVRDPPNSIRIEQGHSIDRPSELIVDLELESGVIHKVWLSGRATTINQYR
jgi:PhzF family phenazine biosynthesis protein